MLMYSCAGFDFGDLTDEDLIGTECFTNTGQSGGPFSRCTVGSLVAAWAVGAEVCMHVHAEQMYHISALYT